LLSSANFLTNSKILKKSLSKSIGGVI